MKVPIALTLEIFGDESAPNEDCFRMFNPISHDQLEEVISKWSAIFFSLLANLPTTLSRVPRKIGAASSWGVVTEDTEDGVIQDPKLLQQFESPYEDQNSKFGRGWQGLDPMSMEGLRTPDLQVSLQFYLFFCGLLLILSWFRFSKYYRRFFTYARPSSQRL